MNQSTFLEETSSGSWVRFPATFRKRCSLIKLQNGVILNVCSKSNHIEVLIADESDVYQPINTIYVTDSGKFELLPNDLPPHYPWNGSLLFYAEPNEDEVLH